MGSASQIFARENSWAEIGQPSLQIADHPQVGPFAIRRCHSTRLEAGACSRGPGDMEMGFIAGQGADYHEVKARQEREVEALKAAQQ